MSELKYNVGNKVLIKSIDWWNRNNDNNIVESISYVKCKDWNFISDMKEYCGKILTIAEVHKEFNRYKMSEDNKLYSWTDEMIECKVEEENIDCEKCSLTRNSTRCLFMDNCPHNKQKTIIEIPEDWVLKDENDNEILTSKIVLEKKKKEVTYPKTYEECCRVLGVSEFEYNHTGTKMWYRHKSMATLDNLMLCRDAYWKIAGEEMGLDKPWEPDWYDDDTVKYCIIVDSGIISKQNFRNYQFILAFPTAEMRDTFYENFKKEIEICKELL